MNTTATATGPILAIDLGKYQSVACIFRSPDDVRFMSVPTTSVNDSEPHRPADAGHSSVGFDLFVASR